MLSPAWMQFKIGPILRGEADNRIYYNLFKERKDDIKGIKRILYQYFVDKNLEPSDLYSKYKKCNSTYLIIIFEGYKDYFQKLSGWDKFLHNEIRRITKDRWIREIDQAPHIPIGIHIRRGDFIEAKSESDFYYKGGIKTPLSWFMDSLDVIRETIGYKVGAFVVSDGNEDELKDLLSLENVTLISTRAAISDLLIMTKAQTFIASGGSSFSAWISFLGQMPTISYPGQSLKWFKLENANKYYIGEFDPHSPPEQYLNELKFIFDKA